MMKIAVASGKGGTGKTTLSINLAAYLAENKILPNITLVDLDVEEPNSGLFINGRIQSTDIKYKMIPEWDKRKCSACGLCERLCRFNSILGLGKTIMVLPELCHSCHACSELCPEQALPMKQTRIGEMKSIDAGDFAFIESRLDIGQEQAVPLIAQSIEYIDKPGKPRDRMFIIDSPPGTSCPVIEVAKNSDFIILVTEPTPFGLHDLRLAVESFRGIGRSFAVVINRWGIGNDDVIEYCRTEKIRIIAKLPNSRRIAEIYSEGRLIYKKVPAFENELGKVSDFIAELAGYKI